MTRVLTPAPSSCPPARRLRRRCAALLRRIGPAAFGRDRSGVAAVEFALVLPIMLTMYLGMVELSQGIGHERKGALVARTLSDLVTQQASVTTADMTSIFSASTTLLAPYPNTGITMRVSSFMVDAAGKAFVDWSDIKNQTSPGPYTAHARCADATTLVPAVLRIPLTSIVIAEVKITHVPAIGYYLGTVTMEEKLPTRPRVSANVTHEGVPTTPCAGYLAS